MSWIVFMSNTQCQDSWSHSQWPTSNALQLVLWQHYNAAEVSGELNQRGKNDVWHFGTCHFLKTHHASWRALSKQWWKTSCNARARSHLSNCCAVPWVHCHILMPPFPDGDTGQAVLRQQVMAALAIRQTSPFCGQQSHHQQALW